MIQFRDKYKISSYSPGFIVFQGEIFDRKGDIEKYSKWQEYTLI